MAKRKTHDWEAIEREYRAGQLSIAEIARQHGVSRAAIQKRAKQKGWRRDLSEKVRRGIQAELVASKVAPCNEAKAIDDAVLRGVEVVRRQQSRLIKLQGALDKLHARLESKEGKDEPANRDLCELTRTATQTAKTLTELERTVFNLDDKPDADTHKLEVEVRAKIEAEMIEAKLDEIGTEARHTDSIR